jgi:hypothetical protein
MRAKVLKELQPMCESDHEECCGDIRVAIGAKLEELDAAFRAECGPCEEWVEEVFDVVLGKENSGDARAGLMEKCLHPGGLVGQMEAGLRGRGFRLLPGGRDSICEN